jgi:hypothetical protein
MGGCLKPSDPLLCRTKASKELAAVGAHVFADGGQLGCDVLNTSGKLGDGKVGGLIFLTATAYPAGCTTAESTKYKAGHAYD